MQTIWTRTPAATAVAVAVGFALSAVAGAARADDTQAEIAALKAQVQTLMKRVEELSSRQQEGAAKTQQIEKKVEAQASQPAAGAGGTGFTRTSPDTLSFSTPGHGQFKIYGNLDVSVDDTTKGTSGLVANGAGPVGNVGWMPAISTNNTYVGVSGFQPIGDGTNRFVWQLETLIALSATAGNPQSNSNQSDSTYGLTSRNSFIGVAGDGWGALKIGKTDAPYKTSTQPFNPFNGMIGDYSVVMGNTGGDNRVEFGGRIDHALWYESPDLGGARVNVLFSPGQNRSTANDNLAAGEADCSGGNIPGSGGGGAASVTDGTSPTTSTALVPSCTDGAFGNAFSANVSYGGGRDPLLLTAAYEWHQGVNRTGDLNGDTLGDGVSNIPYSYVAADVADEWAAKVGALYRFSATGTTVGAIYEKLVRDVPTFLQYQNERTRNGSWVVVSQDLGLGNVVHLGWAHAGSTPGDPGQHNTAVGANPPNTTNMFTLAAIHQVDSNLAFYADYAVTINGANAHYDLGAGSHGVTTDCHDAGPDAAGNYFSNPHCWAGGRLEGISVGTRYRF